MSRIVVSADDFGLCPEINEAICLLHDRGVVRRASFIVNMDGFESSVEALRSRPSLDVAVHLNLTDGRPILPAALVPTLVDRKGFFHGGRHHYGVVARIAAGRMRTGEIHREWRAQIEKARAAGLRIQQLNSHGHLHLLPRLHGIVLALLHEFEISDVRLVRSFDSVRGVLLSVCSLRLMRSLKRHGPAAVAPDRTLGLRRPGSIDARIDLRRPAGADASTELIAHPSKGSNEYHRRWGYAGDDELARLLNESI